VKNGGGALPPLFFIAPARLEYGIILAMTRADLELLEVLPEQGSWTERQYLALNTRRLVEYDDGVLEVLPLPTRTHQFVVAYLFERLKAFIAMDGRVLFSPYRLRIPTRKYREPDVLWLTPAQIAQSNEEFADAAELVMEVVSPDDPDRDYVTKRKDYAQAGIKEYWIVDHLESRVTVLRLEDNQYTEHGLFGPRQMATSHRLPGFSIAVDEILAQGL
jgi:Uma2 family endonuclease